MECVCVSVCDYRRVLFNRRKSIPIALPIDFADAALYAV